jgi:hypothetical protein
MQILLFLLQKKKSETRKRLVYTCETILIEKYKVGLELDWMSRRIGFPLKTSQFLIEIRTADFNRLRQCA